jgi:PhoPQ-activated pathogenicity-related protein
VVQHAPLPRFNWKFAQDGSIRVMAVDKPTEVKLWQATNPQARDFRLDTIGPGWASSPVTPGASGEYVGKIETPTNGWSAFFLEMTFPGNGSFPFKFTTGVRVLPDKLPYQLPPANLRK